MFASDRDLLVLEPRLFFDIAWTAQQPVNAFGGSIDAAGTTLTLPGGSFDAQGVTTGNVVLSGGIPLEVISRISATDLSVSRLRAGVNDPVLPASSGSNLTVKVLTFAPQIGVVHEQLLRAIGIEPSAAPGPGVVTAADITNGASVARAEALGALHLIFASAAALVDDESPLWVKAQMYRNRFSAARRELAVQIDLNGDGVADVTRRPNVLQFVRG